MSKLLSFLREQIRHQELVLVGMLLSVLVLWVPLQHYIPLAKFQHVGLSAFVVSVSFLLQLVISWRSISALGRMTLAGSTTFVGILACFLWMNPWLSNPDLATTFQLQLSTVFLWFMAALFFALFFVWIRWALERHSLLEAPIDKKGSG